VGALAIALASGQRALVFPWWNVRTQTVETVTLPAVTLDVGHAPLPQGTRNRLGAAVVAVVLLAALALWWAAGTDSELRTLVEGLEAAIVAGQKRWDGAPRAAALRRARSRSAAEPRAAALPALNPG
jgi:hypothetical protein